ncbi:Putative protein kinase superfamily protein [Klebsormidium nitens]|uniref:Protein kinase domain-containing protein n=1 Tax=Klebsormidium nitens TaxID=105231 RepID=A0A0U9HIJ1_KLENI|nr:Putative protein kinase superfamily protein [Klebsormidium nitens]|eukprot:GAQ80585.1 Putative protein kinase superfamily protein [Klebsormidium nitens]
MMEEGETEEVGVSEGEDTDVEGGEEVGMEEGVAGEEGLPWEEQREGNMVQSSREEESAGTPGADRAEAACPQVADYPTAAASAASAHVSPPPQREQRGYDWGLDIAEGGLFSSDAFTPPTATSSPFSLFSDPAFPAQPIPTPRAAVPSTVDPFRTAPQIETPLIEDPLPETLADLGFVDVPLTAEEGDESEIERAVLGLGLDDGEAGLEGGDITRDGEPHGRSSELGEIGGGLFSSDAFVPPAGASSPFSLFSDPVFACEPIPSPRAAEPSCFESVPLGSSPPVESSPVELPDIETWSGLGFADVPLTGDGADEGDIVRAVVDLVFDEEGPLLEGAQTEREGEERDEVEAGEIDTCPREEESVGTPGAEAAAGPLWAGEAEAAPQVQDSWEGAVPSVCPIQYADLARVLPFIPNVRLVRELARGGQGVVFAGEARTGDGLSFSAAIKFAVGEEAPLVREAVLHAACSGCTNLIPVRGFSLYLGRFALVFDLADGPPTWTQPGAGVQCTPVQLYRAVRFLWQALQGLEDMHGLGVVHRDVKPENLLSQRGVGKLADLGLATYLHEPQGNGRCGTPRYVAPEVFYQGFQDRRSDVYAVGKTIHAIVTGTRPNTGFCDTKALLGSLVVTGGRQAWPAAVHVYGAEVVQLADACCAPDPDQRPTAADITDALLGTAVRLRKLCQAAAGVLGACA